MARIAIQSTQWDYTVLRIKASAGEGPHAGKIAPNLFLHQREDNGEIVGIGTEDYGIIQNRELMEAARNALDQRGMNDYKQRIIVTGKGEKFYAEFTFENRQLARDKGDIFGFRLTLQNSFDRSKRAAFQLGFLRLVCTNGMATTSKEFCVTQKHSARLNLKFLGTAIDNALANGNNALKTYDELAQIILTDEKGQNVLAYLQSKGDLSGVVREGIENLWLNPKRQEDKARTLYSLYNAVTEFLTHNVADERYEYANELSSNLLLRFVTLARNPERFKEATTKIVREGEPAVTIRPEVE